MLPLLVLKGMSVTRTTFSQGTRNHRQTHINVVLVTVYRLGVNSTVGEELDGQSRCNRACVSI
jgi:hypothetical protein